MQQTSTSLFDLYLVSYCTAQIHCAVDVCTCTVQYSTALHCTQYTVHRLAEQVKLMCADSTLCCTVQCRVGEVCEARTAA